MTTPVQIVTDALLDIANPVIDDAVNQKIQDADIGGKIDAKVNDALSGILKGDKGDPGTDGIDGKDGKDGIGGAPSVPAWMPTNEQVGTGWNAFKAALDADAERCKKLPPVTCGKVNLATANSGSAGQNNNLISAALSLAEGRIYATPHSTQYPRTFDIHSLQMALQEPSLGSGTGRSNGSALFPDGEIVTVPNNSGQCWALDPKTETGRVVASGLATNAAYCGGAPWVDNESILLAPHGARHACLINKRTGEVTHLTDYTFTGLYACAGVRRVGVTGEYLFVPHYHDKFVLLDPSTSPPTFRELTVQNRHANGNVIIDAYVSAVNLNDGRMYLAAHHAPCSIILDVVNDVKTNTLPPSGAGFVPLSSTVQANFRSCVRLVDGRVLLIPYKHSKAWVYDPETNKHTQCAGNYGNGDVACGAMAKNGDVYLMPWNGGMTYKISAGYGFDVDPNILTSPLFNGL